MPKEIHFFYDQLWRGVLEESKRVAPFGIEFLNHPVQVLGEGDTEAFKELVKSGVNGISLTAGRPKDLKPLMDEAEEKGGHVVYVSTNARESKLSRIGWGEPA